MPHQSTPEKRLSQRDMYGLDKPPTPPLPSSTFQWKGACPMPDNFKPFNPDLTIPDPLKKKQKLAKKLAKESKNDERHKRRHRRVKRSA